MHSNEKVNLFITYKCVYLTKCSSNSHFPIQEKEMELDSLREQTRRDVEGIHKKLQVSIHAVKLENWEPVKPRPNDRNSSTQHIATLLTQYLQVPAKRSQHFDARNISQYCWAQHVACGWPPCCNVLRHVAS